MRRGFDTFNGYIGRSGDYYTHISGDGNGYDYRKNYEIDLDVKGIYQSKLMAAHSKDIIDNVGFIRKCR